MKSLSADFDSSKAEEPNNSLNLDATSSVNPLIATRALLYGWPVNETSYIKQLLFNIIYYFTITISKKLYFLYIHHPS